MDIPHIFHIYVLAMFHIFSLVCFLIYGVKRRQVLIAKPRFYFYVFRVYTFYIFISNFMISIKMNYFLSKIGSIWAHKGPMGPYGPQPGLGPNPNILRIFGDFSGPYGPIRAHMGPARAP